jgi:hypothetical protein
MGTICDICNMKIPPKGRLPNANGLISMGWGGRIRTSAWRNQNPLPYRLATPQRCLLSQAAARGGRTIMRVGTSRNLLAGYPVPDNVNRVSAENTRAQPGRSFGRLGISTGPRATMSSSARRRTNRAFEIPGQSSFSSVDHRRIFVVDELHSATPANSFRRHASNTRAGCRRPRRPREPRCQTGPVRLAVCQFWPIVNPNQGNRSTGLSVYGQRS